MRKHKWTGFASAEEMHGLDNAEEKGPLYQSVVQ
jgi:hypothetical protein